MDLVELKRNAVDAGRNPAYIMDFDGDIWIAIPKSHFDLIREDYGL